ncbi:MAG: DUF839 domain-containing protein [Bacteroidia bacterium]|nr:DUF839 domain-containing protein [Bacteroidia bacterium]
MKNSSRREFLRLSALASLGFSGLFQFACNVAESGKAIMAKGFGPLIPDPQKILDLPAGFSYKIISQKLKPMSDGLLTPGAADGMATFARPDGKVALIRNHELNPNELHNSPFGKNNEHLNTFSKEHFYDFGNGEMPAIGGTTTLIFNEETQTVETEFLSLIGTIRNCAGGPTPWGSWITCEETESMTGEFRNEVNHGYNFEVPVSDTPGLAAPVPLRDMGRFSHEAICVDPRSGIVYQTEDQHDSLIYRFIPNVPGQLAQGGKLQVLKVREYPSLDTRNWPDGPEFKLLPGLWLETEWMDIEDVESPANDLRIRGHKKGAALFARGEGMWFGDNEVYFACTNGGKKKEGQIFRYIPSEFEGTDREKEMPGRLQLFVEPNNSDICSSCDNITMAPWGDIVMCEDKSDPNIVGLTLKGEFYHIGSNKGYPDSEFTGVCFSPSGKTLFINMQGPGLTFAITGPWNDSMQSA